MYDRIAAFGAHPDDIEIGCFGTIFKFLRAGATVDLFIATGDNSRLEESNSAIKCLGNTGWTIHNLGYSNNEIPYSTDIISDIDSRLSKFEPDLVITHWVGDNQQDHQNIAKSVISACRKRDTIWMMEPPPGRPPIHGVFRPQVYVDITDAASAKAAAIMEHQSQVNRLGISTDFDPIDTRARLHGTSINVEAAEVFEVVKHTVRFI